MKTIKSFLIIFAFGIISINTMAQTPPTQLPLSTANDTLLVVWSSGDIEVAEKVCFMYTYNAKKWGWFENIIFVIWGPSAQLLAGNEDLQKQVKKMQEEGIIVEACIACARMYGVDEELKECGIDVKGMGTVLTRYLKAGYPNITF
jgi:hypothetical protein